MAHKDYYQTLGVDKKATPEQIKKAYRALALKFHPDKNQGNKVAEDKFKEVNEANTVLSDPEKRKKYNQFGEHWENPQYTQTADSARHGNPASGTQNQRAQGTQFSFDTSDFEDGGNYEDVFRQFFGGQSGGKNPSRNGENVEAEVLITLEEAFSGSARSISVGNKTHKLTIKKGVRESQQFQLRGKGQPGKNGGKNGDFLIHIRIAPNARYVRTGNDLRCQQPVELLTAVLGGKTSIQTMHGEKMMNIRAGIQYGTVLRMRGLGMPDYDISNVFGDLFVEVLVQIPEQLTEAERGLYGQIAALKN
jgi:curved DNA-binding protein